MSIGHNGGPPIRDGNWIAIDRSILNHHVVGAAQPVKPADPSRGAYSVLEAWLWCLTNAAYKPSTVLNKGREMTLEPGQVMAGRAYLAKVWNWSEMTVRWQLKRWLDMGMITLATEKIKEQSGTGKNPQVPENHNQQRTNTANVLTICNWLKYQLDYDDQQPPQQPAHNQRATSEQPASNHNLTNKQINNLREEREEVISTADAVPVSLEVVGAFEAYNDLAQRVGLPVARTLTPQRRKAIAARMREHGGQGAWARLLSNIERSAFLQGRNSRNWMPPGLDWFLTPANFTKVCEGAYGNGVHANPVQPSESYIDRMRRLMHGEGDMPRGPKTIEGEVL